jgi:hypothetical protein
VGRTVKRARVRVRSELAVTLAALALTSCGQSGRAPFAVEIVTAAGANPVAGATTGRLRVLVAQDGQPTRDQAVDLSGGSFQLDVTIASYGAPTRLGVELVRDGETSLGAVPTFAPLGFGFVRVPVVPAGTCASVATQRLATPRAEAAVAAVDALLAVVGGVAADGTPASGLERFWSPQLTASTGSGPVHPRALPEGPVRALRFAGQPRVLLVGDRRAVVLDFGGDTVGDMIDSPLAAHVGVGAASALVDLGASGLAIVGGAEGATPVATISWVGIDRSVQRSALSAPRAGAAAVAWGASEGILIAGGQDAGEPTFAYVPAAASAREEVLDFELPTRPTAPLHGGALLRSPDGRSALWVGATNEAGDVSRETWLVRGCPAACEVVPGPAWPAPRTRFEVARTSDGAWIVGGREGTAPSARVERVTWTGGAPSFASTTLVVAREDAAVTALAAGMLLVVGGRGAGGALDGFELCAPASLETP